MSVDGNSLKLADQVAAKILARQAAAHPERLFVRFQGKWVSYGEMDRRANRAANFLAAQGLGSGSRVAILLRNRLEFLDLWFGLSRIGGIQVPINVDYKAPQIKHTLDRSPVQAVVVESALLDEFLMALGEMQRPPAQAFTVDGGGMERLQSAAASGLSVKDYDAEVRRASDIVPATAEGIFGTQAGAIMNTSGTTGPSKGVLVSHAQQYILGRNIAADMSLGPNDIYLNFYPLYHNTAQAMITIPVLLKGARMVLAERFSASRFWEDVEESGCTAFYYLGEVIRILLTTGDPKPRRSTLRVGWGIGAGAQDAKEFAQRYGVVLCTGYGSTEANVPCYQPHDGGPAEACGKVIEGFEVRVADPLGQPLAAGNVGEILVRSSEPCALMLGYDGDPLATIETWRDLWFHTGDTGCFDADGNLYFKGRLKDAIRVKGENVPAFEVEQVLCGIAGVKEAAAIAVPCDLGGDDLKAVLVVEAGAGLTPQAILEKAEQSLPRLFQPRYIELVDALPKTATNKVQKNLLRKTPFTPGTWDRQAARKAQQASEPEREQSRVN